MASLKLLPVWTKWLRPQEGRVAVLSPRQYYALISQVDTNILNRDLGATGGSLNTGEGLYEIAGIKIYKSNNIPFLERYGSAAGEQIDAAALGGENNDYGIRTDFTNSCGLIFHRDAAGVVEAIGPSVQTTGADTKVIYQGDVIVGRLAYGCWLCPHLLWLVLSVTSDSFLSCVHAGVLSGPLFLARP